MGGALMVWFKVDDKLHDHRKARSAGATAMGVWCLAGSWAADNLTDGFVPASILRRWGRPRDAARLVEVGLWVPDRQDGEDGWRFHEWTECQPSRAQKEAEREVRAASGRAGGLASGVTRRQNAKVQVGHRGGEVAAARRKPNESEPAGSQASAADEPALVIYPQVALPVHEANGKHSASPLLEPPTRPVPSLTNSANAETEFDDFWLRYPRKIAKGQARKAWKAALRKVDDPRTVLDAARSYSVRVHGAEPNFIPYPATWLNGERWLDELEAQAREADGTGGWQRPGGPPPAPPEIADDPERYAAWLAEWRDAQ